MFIFILILIPMHRYLNSFRTIIRDIFQRFRFCCVERCHFHYYVLHLGWLLFIICIFQVNDYSALWKKFSCYFLIIKKTRTSCRECAFSLAVKQTNLRIFESFFPTFLWLLSAMQRDHRKCARKIYRDIHIPFSNIRNNNSSNILIRFLVMHPGHLCNTWILPLK